MEKRILKNCPDCNVKPSELHLNGCDVERCPVCGFQLISCRCDAKESDRIPWRGIYPGVLECREFGWYARLTNNGWVKCSKDHPGATEDLNRLYDDCKWDKTKQRFVR